MALANYSDLKTAIAGWMKRGDLTPNIPDFIALAEARMNRDLTMRFLETEQTYTGTINTRTLALPADYSTPVALYNTSFTPRQGITQVLPMMLQIVNVPKRPDYWIIDGQNIAFDGNLDIAYTFAFRYKRRFALSDATPTNDALTDHPDVYLFGALVEAATYIYDEQRAGYWDNKYMTALKEASRIESTSYQDTQLRTDELVNNKRFNINAGY